MGVINKIQKDTWIKNYSLPCVRDHLERNTVQTIIYPHIERLQNDGANDDEFIIQISESLQEHQNIDDISNTIKCIMEKIEYAFGEDEFPIPQAFLSNAAFTVLGKSILIISKKLGYVR